MLRPSSFGPRQVAQKKKIRDPGHSGLILSGQPMHMENEQLLLPMKLKKQLANGGYKFQLIELRYKLR
jgi:hypothetical protein